MTDEARAADGRIQSAVAAASQMFQGLARDLRDALARGDTVEILAVADRIDGTAQSLHAISAMSHDLANR